MPLTGLSPDWTQLRKESVNLKMCQWKRVSIVDEKVKQYKHIHCWWSVWQLLTNIIIAIILIGICNIDFKTYVYKNTCMQIFIAAFYNFPKR